MKLSQAETIQIMRKRTGMNQGELGARAFGTSFQAGRTKIKNIELGKQLPTSEDLENMAKALQIPLSVLLADAAEPSPDPRCVTGIELEPSLLALFPGLDIYVDLLNKAARLRDMELIEHITAKICDLLGNHSTVGSVARN